MTSGFTSWFWNPDFWLPPNVTWDSFKQPEVVNEDFVSTNGFARFGDLWYPIPLSIIVMLARWVVERVVFKRMGVRLGMKDYKRPFPPRNMVLENAFRRSNVPSLREMDFLSKDSGMSIKQVRSIVLDRVP